ncbi:SufB/SufD family protein [Pseudotabrizicola formosa]|uniref:SufB/SufD family protein n=1 Tax=Pseudotabrizicola formosa TaxID=2030009 RepID=UPI000CD18809|nr:SufD family Fe-S cluster assembly protein [Pseudotabrizicola formosa]
MMRAEAKTEALTARTAALTASGSGWLGAARRDAVARLAAMGLPTKRDEYWRYTDPASLTAATPEPAALFDAGDEAPAFDGIDAVKLVFVDGMFDPAQSDDPATAGIEITHLSQAEGVDIHWAREVYGVLEARGQIPVQRPLATLNTAYATQGFLIRATAKAAKPVSFIYHHKSTTSDALLHHCIKMEPGSELTILESGPAAARMTSVMEVEVADGARFHHIRAQGRDHARRAATHVFSRIGAGALFKSFTLTANGCLTRNEQIVELVGNDGVAHVAGAAVGDGTFHHDDTVFMTHEGLRCESRQVFKKVLMNGAVGVFQGKILVKPGAQKTDGYQISQSLLLDGDSQFLAKPELEIYADDVKCSHGSTSGAIDDTALFYLQSRGVPKRVAQSLLVLAFLAEAIGEIEDEAIAEDIRLRLEGWLQRHEH